MGIRERQERDREAVRRRILDAARELFVSEGYHNVSIRKIAERIEYSPAALYSYFPAKDDIFFALAEEGFRLLHGTPADLDALEALPPLERIRGMFWRLYEFSCQQPAYFALMFVDRTVPSVSANYERFAFAREMRQRALAHVQKCVDEGLFPADIPPAVAFRILTTGLIGVAVLRNSDRLKPGENADDLARDVLNVTLAGLRSGVAVASSADWCAVEDAASSSLVAPSKSS
jgi:AcrR family transcriptional regulator